VSPLSKHFILPYGDLPGDWEYWENYSVQLLKRCDAVFVITDIQGWEKSTGVQGEITAAKELGIPVYAVTSKGEIVGEW
jgi:precorrin-6x reductase